MIYIKVYLYGGYTKIIEKLLNGIEVKLNTEYSKEEHENIANKIIYTGKIDEYYNYIYGKLEYRSLKFETKKIECDNYQGNAVINYTDRETPYTRIIEHKHFENNNCKDTIITYEYPDKYEIGKEAYYTINNDRNNKLYEEYKNIPNEKVIFAGRLGEYKYYDMDKTIEKALELIENIKEVI